MPSKASDYLESSFLKPLLERNDVTDITYNGESLFFLSNVKGRQKSEIEIGKEEVGDFLKQIANLCEKQFSFSSPILDTSFSRYRLNAVFHSLARQKGEKTYSFALRIASPDCKIDDSFFPVGTKELLLEALSNHESVVIGGPTGSGKTELEKWLLMNMPQFTRVIVIDNVEELDLTHHEEIDETIWVTSPNENGSYASLVKNVLRNCPDYIVLAETRGEEFEDALNAVMSGHPIITTLHAQSIDSMVDRMARLVMLSPKNHKKKEVKDDIIKHFSLLVMLSRVFKENEVKRYIESVGRIDKKSGRVHKLFERGKI